MKEIVPKTGRVRAWLIRYILVSGLLFFASVSPSGLLAQVTTAIIPDATLPGGNNSIVAPIGSRVDITGGHAVGPNLFHSFGDFHVGAGDTANFFGQGASNILSRVTGSNPSNIFGTLGIDTHLPDVSRSDANLFFLNPNGVVFGPTSSLDLKGSFHVSTADYIRLGAGQGAGRFSATDPGSDLITSAPPAAFGFLGTNPKGTTLNARVLLNQSTLVVGQTRFVFDEQGKIISIVDGGSQILSVIGRDALVGNVVEEGVEFRGVERTERPGGLFTPPERPGGGPAPILSAPGGRVNVASVGHSQTGEVLLNEGLDFESASGNQPLGKISFSELLGIAVHEGRFSGFPEDGPSSIVIRGGRLEVSHSLISTMAFGDVIKSGPISLTVKDILIKEEEGSSPIPPVMHF